MDWFIAVTMCVRGRQFGTLFRRGSPFWRPVTVLVSACRLLSVVAADDRARPRIHQAVGAREGVDRSEGSALDVQTSVRELVLVQMEDSVSVKNNESGILHLAEKWGTCLVARASSPWKRVHVRQLLSVGGQGAAVERHCYFATSDTNLEKQLIVVGAPPPTESLILRPSLVRKYLRATYSCPQHGVFVGYMRRYAGTQRRQSSITHLLVLNEEPHHPRCALSTTCLRDTRERAP